jgi:hypothetical protein
MYFVDARAVLLWGGGWCETKEKSNMWKVFDDIWAGESKAQIEEWTGS